MCCLHRKERGNTYLHMMTKLRHAFLLALIGVPRARALKSGRWNRFKPQQRLIFHALKISYTNGRTSNTSLRYGRGAEIWPECNEEPVQLKDSFPNGIIPALALDALQNPRQDQQTLQNPGEPSGNLIQRIIVIQGQGESAVDITPTVIAALLLIRGLVGPMDIMIVTAITGYWFILQRYSQSTRIDGVTPALPSLPPQGHVPDLVANPLGNSFTNSNDYDQWLKLSAVLSLLLPIGLIVKQLSTHRFQAATLFSRPLFFLCCQAMSESIARKYVVSNVQVLSPRRKTATHSSF
jgi:hypothetical protein